MVFATKQSLRISKGSYIRDLLDVYTSFLMYPRQIIQSKVKFNVDNQLQILLKYPRVIFFSH